MNLQRAQKDDLIKQGAKRDDLIWKAAHTDDICSNVDIRMV